MAIPRMRNLALVLFSTKLGLALALGSALAAQTLKEYQFELKTLGGQTITQAQFQENVVIVDYWGTWCPPCRQAVPVLEKLYQKYKHHGLEIIGLNYENQDPAKSAATVRKFAAEQGITYPLALGTPALQKAVPKFGGYPTLLQFNKGMVHVKTTVGWNPAHEKELEHWIRVELGLDQAKEGGAQPTENGEEPAELADEEAKEEVKEELQKGVIHKPGEGDTGFEFEATDVDGKEFKFADLKGKPVLLALTSSWDPTAVTTATLLNELHEKHAGRNLVVLAAQLEVPKQDAAKVAAITPFRAQHGLKYRMFPAGLSFQRKIHQFVAMPLFLVFDAEGKLVLREQGISDRVRESLGTTLEGLLAK